MTTIFSGDPITSFTGENRFLSNFYPHHPDGKTVEHYYQAEKAFRYGSIDLYHKIWDAPTPGQAKNFAKEVVLDDDWHLIKVGVMLMFVKDKFSEYPNMKQMLLETGERELVEGNTWGDTFWGVCGGKGENMLGKILMHIRLGIQYGII